MTDQSQKSSSFTVSDDKDHKISQKTNVTLEDIAGGDQVDPVHSISCNDTGSENKNIFYVDVYEDDKGVENGNDLTSVAGKRPD